jgi:glycosyltransferase involved in cell wall biosynthesis
MISFIVPSIRVDKLKKTYDSIDTLEPWEMVVVSPYAQPHDMRLPNVQWVTDWGHLVRARQLGLLAAKGDYVAWMVDDGTYVPGAVDKAFALCGADKVVSLMVKEGGGGENSLNPYAYKAWFHEDLRLPYVPVDTTLILFAIAPTDKIKAVGGWDCRFEGMGLADVDLSIRLKTEIVVAPFHAVSCEWMPGETGDHKPVHQAHFENDLPYFKSIYDKRVVKLDNWKDASARWSRRFGV